MKQISAILVLTVCGLPSMLHADVLQDEFIRVAPDHWSFEGARSHERFIPFGSNFVLDNKDELNVFGPTFSESRYDQILRACESLHINVVKAFLPIGAVLPDPQTPGEVHIAPGYLDNLDRFLQLCQKHHIRVIVCFSCWGGNGCKWWHEGGQYFGRVPWKTDPGIDSLDILCRFWTELATRFKDNPVIFSYTPAVEWTMPASNLTWFPPEGYNGAIPSEPGLWYWRAWLRAKYGMIEKLNAAWDTAYGAFDEVTMVDYAYDRPNKRYVDPEPKIFDYANFRDWATVHYFTPQVAAIRAAGPNHMITISNHMRFWDLEEGGARNFLGATPFEQKSLVDYMSFHANYSETDNAPGRTDADIVHHVEMLARFCAAGRPMPLLLEEYSYPARDPNRMAEVQAAIVRDSIGHVSGWTTWYLQYPNDPQPGADHGGKEARSCWLDSEFHPTPWGETAKTLYEELTVSDLKRLSAKETVALDRRTSLVPRETGILIRHWKNYTDFPHPLDYVPAHHPDLDINLSR